MFKNIWDWLLDDYRAMVYEKELLDAMEQGSLEDVNPPLDLGHHELWLLVKSGCFQDPDVASSWISAAIPDGCLFYFNTTAGVSAMTRPGGSQLQC